MAYHTLLILAALLASQEHTKAGPPSFPDIPALRNAAEHTHQEDEEWGHRRDLFLLLDSWQKSKERAKIIARIEQQFTEIDCYVLLEIGDAFSHTYNLYLVVDNGEDSTFFLYQSDWNRKKSLRTKTKRNSRLASEMVKQSADIWDAESDTTFHVADGEGIFLTVCQQRRRHTVCTWGVFPRARKLSPYHAARLERLGDTAGLVETMAAQFKDNGLAPTLMEGLFVTVPSVPE